MENLNQQPCIDLTADDVELIEVEEDLFDDVQSIPEMIEDIKSIKFYYWYDVYRFFGLDPYDSHFDISYDQFGDMTSAFMDVHDCAYYGAEKQDFFPSIYARELCDKAGKTNLFCENFS